MKKNLVSSSLKYLLLSGMLLRGIVAHGQQNITPPNTSDTLYRPYNQKAYLDEMRTYKEMDKNFREGHKLDRRAGILFVKGAEHYNDTTYVSLSGNKINSMMFAFSNNVFDFVGSVEQGFEVDSVLTHLDKMGDEVTGDIILNMDAHGRAVQYTDPMAPENKQGVYRTDNLIRLHYRKDGLLYTDSVYGRIGRRFEENPKLKNKHFFFMSYLCHGYGGAEAMTQLPVGTVGLVFSGVNENTWNTGYYPSVENIFNKNQQLTMDGDKFIMASILTANADSTGHLKGNLRNKVKMIFIDGDKKDEIKSAGKPYRVITNIGHHATVINPELDIWVMKQMRLSRQELAESFSSHVKGLLSEEKQVEVLNAYWNMKDEDELNALPNDIFDGISGLCCSYMIDHPKQRLSLLQSQVLLNMKGYRASRDQSIASQDRQATLVASP